MVYAWELKHEMKKGMSLDRGHKCQNLALSCCSLKIGKTGKSAKETKKQRLIR